MRPNNLKMLNLSENELNGEASTTILRAILANTKLTNLDTFDLSENPQLFESEDCVDLLSQVIANQINLKLFYLNDNNLRSSMVARMSASIQQSPSLATIETLNLNYSYWNEHEACEQLVNLLASSTALK